MTHHNPQATEAEHVARRHELETARIKLLALAGALLDLPGKAMRFRVDETPQERMKLLRVWDAHMQGRSETVACLKLAEGWRYTAYPHGSVIADADGVEKADHARAAAAAVATHVEQLT